MLATLLSKLKEYISLATHMSRSCSYVHLQTQEESPAGPHQGVKGELQPWQCSIPGVGELTSCRFKDQKNKTSATKQGLVISFGNCKNPETRSLCTVLLRLHILWYDLATNPFETQGDYEV